jgi:excisionase family DNA binding protein
MQKEQYPIVMTAKHVSEILGCSLRIAYEVMEQKDFPLIRVGRLKRVSRDAFFKWLEEQKAS